MIELSVPLHVSWTGGVPVATYLDHLTSLGVKAVEVQLPPALAPAAVASWHDAVNAAIDRGFAVALHAPLAAQNPCWPQVCAWAARISGVLIVHGCTDVDRQTDLVTQTASFVQRLLANLPPTVTIAVEQGMHRSAQVSVAARLRATWRGWRRKFVQQQRPVGVGNGMGTAQIRQPHVLQSDVIYDPALDRSSQRCYSGTGTRADTLQVVEQVARSNCTIAWDLAHDWCGRAHDRAWQSIPDEQFVQQVGYVRLHDVDDRYADHWPLVVGNVPYTSQLRALLRHDFTGTVCVVTRYTEAMRSFGDRQHVLERSLMVARNALKIH